MIYGSVTWQMKAKDKQRLERVKRMIRIYMHGVALRDNKSGEQLRHQLGRDNVSDVMWRGNV